MSEKSTEFFRIMLEFLPSTNDAFEKSIDKYGDVLETVIIEDIFMHEIIKLLAEDKNTKLLESIFNYFEEVINCRDDHLIKIISITVLEILGNDKAILKKAQKYMGPKTTVLQIEADRKLGRN